MMARKLSGVTQEGKYIEKDISSGNRIEFDYVYDADLDAFKPGKSWMATR